MGRSVDWVLLLSWQAVKAQWDTEAVWLLLCVTLWSLLPASHLRARLVVAYQASCFFWDDVSWTLRSNIQSLARVEWQCIAPLKCTSISAPIRRVWEVLTSSDTASCRVSSELWRRLVTLWVCNWPGLMTTCDWRRTTEGLKAALAEKYPP